MASPELIRALIESHALGQHDRFRATAMQVAAAASREGDATFAKAIRDLLKRVPALSPLSPVPIARPPKDLSDVLSASYPKTTLSALVQSPNVTASLERVILEYRHSADLRTHGFEPKRRLLLIGPPGCGKTMTAEVLAGELGLPLVIVHLHSLITRFLGETAAKLHLVFEHMTHNRGVYLFDEFDALGTQRTVGNDVGEMRRVLNSLLQFIERDRSESLLVAATNLGDTLDTALFRRFDSVLKYTFPTAEQVAELVTNRLSLFTLTDWPWQSIQAKAAGLSHADIVRACEDAAKTALLSRHTSPSPNDLIESLAARQHSKQ